MQLIKEMPVLVAARFLGVSDRRLWRLMHHPVDVSRSERTLTQVSKIGIEKTSANAMTPYVTVVVDMDTARVAVTTQGKDGATVDAFANDFTKNGGDPANITANSGDMTTAFIFRITKHLPKARMTLGKFHNTILVTDAIDEAHRDEVATDGIAAILKGSRNDVSAIFRH